MEQQLRGRQDREKELQNELTALEAEPVDEDLDRLVIRLYLLTPYPM